MFCKHCGKQISDSAKFCKYCGGSLVKETNQSKVIDEMDSDKESSLDNNEKGVDSPEVEEVSIKGKADEAELETASQEDEIDVLYNLLKNDKNKLTSIDYETLIKDFTSKSTKIVKAGNGGKYKLSVTDSENGILIYNPFWTRTSQIELFSIDELVDYEKEIVISNNSVIYAINAEAEKIEDVEQKEPVVHYDSNITTDDYSSSFYIIDFFKNLIRKGNTGVIIWLVINTVLVTGIIGTMLRSSSYEMQQLPVVIPFFIGLLVYLLSIVIALSPIGEFIVRLQNGCKEIKRKDHLDRLNPIFNKVYSEARKQCPNLPNDIKLYISDDEEPNAFATGRKTVCVTKGILDYTDEEIEAVLGHEFGHIAHKDTDALMVVQTGNLVLTGMFVVFRLFVKIVTLIFHLIFSIISESFGEIIISAFTRVLIDLILVGIMTLWTKLGVLICLQSSRQNEFEADTFCYNLGYGDTLCKVLDKLDSDRSGKKTIWATLNSTHPDTDSRIAHIQGLGSKYDATKDVGVAEEKKNIPVSEGTNDINKPETDKEDIIETTVEEATDTESDSMVVESTDDSSAKTDTISTEESDIGTPVNDSNVEVSSKDTVIRYHVVINGEAKGPYSFDEIKPLITKGEFVRSSFVWREGLSEWTKAENIDELVALFSLAMPPLPPTE